MPLYDYACACGARFELMVPSWSSPAPDCPSCGGATTRRPPSPAVHGRGRATPPPAMSKAPQSWEGLNNGDRDTITHWRRTVEARQEFEANNPEHKEHRDAVAAHEGVFERKPLTYKELASRAATSKNATAAAAEASKDRVKPTAPKD
ncbi:putative FmdB family regulatory protein [Pseudonocardia sediminis]|uniref:Putative FmdB family regulatory protein n=1 Tax=Pseudonocardia sediminis TaxID=1397368 RepID=A0A4Q7UVW5_PSEST|nr:zinc ribbon domain-containing protein [Pseudonocardia sediminis]RZT85915.1 putative FmdB family regulatory protein [Pseudonocardia sediminis]